METIQNVWVDFEVLRRQFTLSRSTKILYFRQIYFILGINFNVSSVLHVCNFLPLYITSHYGSEIPYSSCYTVHFRFLCKYWKNLSGWAFLNFLYLCLGSFFKFYTQCAQQFNLCHDCFPQKVIQQFLYHKDHKIATISHNKILLTMEYCTDQICSLCGHTIEVTAENLHLNIFFFQRKKKCF